MVREFKEKWELTSEELALLLGVSKSTVDHYAIEDRPIPDQTRLFLRYIDALWESWRAQEQVLPLAARDLYRIASRRLDGH